MMGAMRRRSIGFCAMAGGVGFCVMMALGMGREGLPLASARKVDFERDVAPIFAANCVSCHGPEKQKSSYRLDDRAVALKGGELGKAIVPGNGAGSPLIQYVAGAHD